MNPDANAQGQNDDQDVSKYVKEAADRILNDERAQPGSQDPDAIKWAQAHSGGAASSPAPMQPAQPQPMQPVAPTEPTAPPPPAPAPKADDGVLYINQEPGPQAATPGSTVAPTSTPPQDNGTTNGDNNGNSN